MYNVYSGRIFVRGGVLYHEFQGPEAEFQVKYGVRDNRGFRWHEHSTLDCRIHRIPRHGELPLNLEQDNQSCIALLTTGRSTAETTWFIEVRKSWISDYIRNGAVNII